MKMIEKKKKKQLPDKAVPKMKCDLEGICGLWKPWEM